ncbi:MAG TPA: cellulase family glycosylhydrolase [Candidatus Dormibacteraeota bacterium]
MRRGPLIAAALLVLAVAALTYPGALVTSMIARLTPPPTPSSPTPEGVLPWLHVAHPDGGQPYIADDRGRMVLFHGAVPADLLDFGTSKNWSAAYPIDPAAYAGAQCPPIVSHSHYPPLCQSDIEEMAALGFNSLRLPLSWSLLEPKRGEFSQTYVDRAAQVVDWAKTLGMYVIIDMHQNAYSHFVQAEPGSGVDLSSNSGAPAWATITDGLPSKLLIPNQREANPAVVEGFNNFWYNRDGIQDEYIKAIALLAKRFKDDSTVAGYSIFNEPQPGWNLPPGFEDLLLFPFYRRVIDAVTGVRDGLPCPTGIYMPSFCGYADLGIHDLRHLFFLEPGLLRQITDFPTHLGLPVSSYPNLVFDIHAYTHGFTIEKLINSKSDPRTATYPWGGYDQTYNLAKREAKAMGAALFVSEFGNDPSYDSLLLANELLEQERHLVGFAFWTWKENGGSNAWGVFDPGNNEIGVTASSGCIRLGRERQLARVYPRASADPKLTYHYDSETGAFTLKAQGRAGDAFTVVSIPREVTGDVTVLGADRSVISNSDGSRVVTATPSGGAFSIAVAAAPLSLLGC